MRRVLMSMAAFATLATATPAMASLVLNPDGSLTASGSGGGTQTVHLNGITDGPTMVPGLTADITLTFSSVSVDGLTYSFLYDLFNSSSGQVTGSRVSSFGFNTSPEATSGTIDGIFNTVHTGSADNYPIIGNPEVCAFASNNPPHGVCTGSGSGVDIGDHGTGTLTLTFATAPVGGILTLSDFVDRYQSIEGVRGLSSAVGQQVPGGVPEPATWALMLLGFGGIGFTMRRSRNQNGRLLQVA